MQMNNAVKILGMVGIAGSMGVVMLNRDRTPDMPVQAEQGPQENNGLGFDPLADDELTATLGVDIDSPEETMRTLTREVQSTRDDNEALAKQNRDLQKEVKRLLAMEDSLSRRIESKVRDTENNLANTATDLNQQRSQSEQLIARLEEKLSQLERGLKTNRSSGSPSAKPSMTTAGGYDIGQAGIPAGLGFDQPGAGLSSGVSDQILWKNPMDATVDPKKGTVSMPEFKGIDFSIIPTMDGIKTGNHADNKRQKAPPESIKAYTIPANSTLVGSTSMTALLGRIPIDGSVTDPYPFKVIVGPENLASNGIHIPNVEGITMSGIAKGDWTLSCVSGEIHSMTFTFQDGTISTYPPQDDKGAGRSKKAFAWFSDEYGIPCVTGKRLTNAVGYLSGRIGLTAASAYASAVAEGEYSNTVSADGVATQTLTGSAITAARNEGYAAGLDEVTDWLDDRQENSFDAVYVPPGTRLHIHMEDQVAIDYSINGFGRKVQHDEFVQYTNPSYTTLD